MDIKMNSEAMQALISKAIIDQLTPEMKEDMIAKALAYLMEPKSNGYGKTESPITASFNSAAYDIMSKILREELEGNEQFKEHVKKMLGDIVAKLMRKDEEYDDMIGRIVDGIISGLRNIR